MMGCINIAPSKCDESDNNHHQICDDGATTAIPDLVRKLQTVAINGETKGLEFSRVNNNINNSKERRAAVLVCLFEGDEGEIRVILTKRSMNLSTHPGEVAFPGGKRDKEDADDTATALREANEEIGLPSKLVHVIANLQPFISLHLLTVVPVVGLLSKVDEFKPVLNADEVDAIFDVPLQLFLQEGEHHKRIEREWRGWSYVCHMFDYETPNKERYVIGGLTATILIHVASIIYQPTPTLNEHLPNFTQLQLMLKYLV